MNIKCGWLRQDLCTKLVKILDPFTSNINSNGYRINIFPHNFEYILVIQDGRVDVDVDVDLDSVDQLKEKLQW